MVTRLDGKEDVLTVRTYLVDADVPFLCGKRMLELWESKMDTKKKILETNLNRKKKEFRMIDTLGNHYGIVLETQGRQAADVLFLEDAQGDLCSYKAVRKVHKVNNHKKKGPLITAYRNAGCMSPELVDTINRVVNDYKVCQKFGKSVTRPKVTLPKVTSFNEVVTLDLKEFGSKYILWMIDSFTRFIQGKRISNKKDETIINTINITWNLNIGFPSVGFFADNGREFANVKLDKLTSKLGLMVKFGPTYSLWSNGLNERYHASADITIRKMMEEKKDASEGFPSKSCSLDPQYFGE